MSERLARSAGTVGAAVMSSRLLGVVRDQVMAGLFGTTMAQDAYGLAMRVPNLVRDLFAEGAMSAAFVPTFTKYLKANGKEAAWHLGNLVLNALILVTLCLVVLGITFAEPLLHLLETPETPAEAERLALAIGITKIVMPFLTLVAVAVAMGGMLNALRRFFIPALSPAAFNVGVILSAVTVVPICRANGIEPIYGIAIGTLLGGLGQIVIQLPLLRREGFRYRPVIDMRDPAMREILLLMGPGTLGLAAAQINLLVNTYLAWDQGEGAISALGFAFRLMYLPIGLFGVSVATAALPEVSRHAASGALGDIRRTVSSSLRLMLMLSVPATIGLVVLASPIIEFIFERGAFTPDSTALTAMALVAYAPGLIGYSAVKIASPTFYALSDSRTPVIVSVTTIALNLGLNLTLVRVMGFQGLAVGTAVAALFNALALLFLLGRRLDGLDGRRVWLAFAKILIASVVMGAAAWATERWLDAVLPAMSWAGNSLSVTLRAGLRVFGAIAAGVVTLAVVAWALRLQEFLDAWHKVSARIRP